MPYASNGDVKLYYETFGDRGDPALLMVNGLGSQCINFRTEWCEQFAAEGFFVIRFDNRDVGLSTKFDGAAPDEVPYLLSNMGDDAVAVLDAAGVDRAHVMGVSMGGMIVQTLAIEHRDRLLSLTSVMSNTGEPGYGEGDPEARGILLKSAPPTNRDEAIERALLGARTWGSPACYDEERIAAYAAESFDRNFCPEGQGRQAFAVFSSPPRGDALRDVTIPALVIHGDKDKLVDISGGKRTAEVIPGARFVVMEGMGHDYPPQYWDRWVALVTDHARTGR
jgi:pimeloyl-ACP methyl ester carboxylesterase